MKKFSKTWIALILVLALAMSFGLSACGGTTKDPATDDPGVGDPNTEAPETETPEALATEPPADEVEGNTFELFAYDLPSGIKKPNEQAGTVTEEHYTTYEYDENGVPGEAMEAALYVYTPYGYDPANQYNILYLMHGGGEDSGYWFGVGPYAEGGERYNKAQQSYTTNVVDNMIANGDCDGVIIVTPTFYNNFNATGDLTRFRYEMKNDIIPMVEAKYSTYAGGNVSAENLIATRDHRAYAGLSMGSMTGFQAIWCGCVDYFSYIGNFSGWAIADAGADGLAYADTILSAKAENFADYDINYWYNGSGSRDIAREPHVMGYAAMLEKGSDFLQEGEDYANGDNCIMVDKPEKGHSYNNWLVDLYNVLNVFFKAP